ncbi:hypothetical protein Tco_0705044 [Tanacetum coccineum]|uniref:Uncharacterized protein n=1 Tax=Tanacetum coccineum TaxID=301880 RepID=A0ABQ4Y519_9ASTR
MADKEKKSTMKGFATIDQADYYSRITSIAVNGKNAYEMKGKFLDDFHNNAFSGANGEDAIEHIEYFLKIVDPIDLPNVNQDKLRVVVFPISLAGDAWRWFDGIKGLISNVPWVHEKPWTDAGVWTEPTPVVHCCKPFNYKNGCLEWPTCNWREDGYCNRENLPGAYIVGNTLRYQDLEWYDALKDSKLKEEALKNKAIMEGMIDEDEESSNEGWRRWDDFDNTNRDNKSGNMMEHEDKERCEVFDDHERPVCYIRRFEMIKRRMEGPRCKEIDDVGKVSTIWKSGSVGVLKSQDGWSTHILAHKLNLENLPSKISGEFLILNLLILIVRKILRSFVGSFLEAKHQLEGSDPTHSKSNWRVEIILHSVWFRSEGNGLPQVSIMSMSPPIRRKYRASVAFATRCRRINKSRRCNRKIRVPIAMWPCRVEEKMTLKEVDGQTIQEFKTKIIAKDGTITRVSGTFQDYETSEEESVERTRKRDLYGFVDHSQLQQRSHRNELAPRRLSQLDGNMNGWLLEDEDEVERNEVDSDLESTASSKPVREKTTKADRDRTSHHYLWCSK